MQWEPYFYKWHLTNECYDKQSRNFSNIFMDSNYKFWIQKDKKRLELIWAARSGFAGTGKKERIEIKTESADLRSFLRISVSHM